MCGLTSNKDEIEIEQNVVTEDKIQQETDNDLPADFPKDLFFQQWSWWLADVFTIKQRWLIYRRVFRF